MKKSAPFLLYSCILLLVLVVSACGGGGKDDPPVQPTLIQSLTMSVDGKVAKMQPDNPTDGMVVTSNFVQDDGYFSISVFNKEEDFSFAILGKMPRLVVGTYDVYQCLNDPGCEDQNQMSLLAPYPNGQPTNNQDGKIAYKSAEVGLNPLTLSITQVEDAVWPGVPGIVKRVKGTFKATMASVEQDKDYHYHIVGPVKQVEGTFDLFCRVL